MLKNDETEKKAAVGIPPGFHLYYQLIAYRSSLFIIQ
ncbi:hypothetical protein T03_17453 [Trichinella britovi]|uniref:Uncharacterized protein n=1 Tax=Trichinella britovi TaxID=45882 RepID=A0A0V1C3E3_TRIBR|nr:hypothetical protein T03_17453 [Trichinella britovi]